MSARARILIALAAAAVIGVAGCFLIRPGPGLAVGSPAPDLALQGTDGKVHRLSDSVGKRAVVIAWFPKAFTGG